ncbi:uncharacterized protein GGS25DRAFT_503485 [Hypoxylon fragiforme]|uniref:uncharacterized protein n=1 Tax=Hypoxylon fragiforme TaxID=63214 RepID=UPI0020C71A79|nr:uncharacterized protein GGS25DRAFT_503485 [Hypoxylon fragiforme]KAI2605088.1 hypothetical protein GGS25DRAFT_503485 [Hypoxylon fragiforme]
MQQLRVLARRLLVLRPSSSSVTARQFTRHTNYAVRVRPQVPFLSVPLSKNHQFRYLTTERKKWLVYEIVLGLKYTAYSWAIVAFSLAAYLSIEQEWLEKKYPTPHEWGFLTRVRFRKGKWVPNRTDRPEPDWVRTSEYAKNVVERLEDPEIEGAGLQDLSESGTPAFDITAKSEPWRRGYYEALMQCAKAAENLDDKVTDTTRHLVFPANQVIGPSNPHPKPIFHGSESAPREENCVRAFPEPENYYDKILATNGFTPKQKMDAALEYAAWFDFKGAADAAGAMYEQALTLATETSPPPYDPNSYVLRDTTRLPSINLLVTLTAVATHKARNGDIATALPILLSILRARRSLPSPQPLQRVTYDAFDEEAPSPSPWTWRNIYNTAKRVLAPPAYPPPPDDGFSPPIRDAKELCEEAALNLYIGEIIYAASTSSSASRHTPEDGLAWTREAVDLAEEQLHKLSHTTNPSSPSSSPYSAFTTPEATPALAAAKIACKECLTSGLGNWRTMVSRLAREEREKAAAKDPHNTGGWLTNLWGDAKSDLGQQQQQQNEKGGRWTAEENVVRERTKRAMEVLEHEEAPKPGLGSIFWA